MGYYIEKLKSSEVERFKKIRLKSLQADPDAFGSTYIDSIKYSEEKWKLGLLSVHCFLATDGQKDIGIVRLVKDENTDSNAWLISMWVDLIARGKGVGDLLIGELILFARSSGFKTITLDVGDYNLNAINLYLRNGFKANGVRGNLGKLREHISEHQLVLELN